MKKYVIEVVCTGNNGRSPMAETIGNHIIKEFNLENILYFISSGTRAEPKYDNILPYDKVVSILNKVSNNGLIKPSNIDKNKYEFDPDYKIIIQDKVHKALKIMRPIESALRDSTLYNIHLEYNGTRTQTIVRDDVSIILGMEQEHVNQINKIYSKNEHKPLITTITKYAGIKGEIPNLIGNTNPKVYFETRDKLNKIIPKVINRFKEEYKI